MYLQELLFQSVQAIHPLAWLSISQAALNSLRKIVILRTNPNSIETSLVPNPFLVLYIICTYSTAYQKPFFTLHSYGFHDFNVLRSLSFRLETPHPQRKSSTSGVDDQQLEEIPLDLANAMSLFFADATPMLNALSAATTAFVQDNEPRVANTTTDLLGVVAKVLGIHAQIRRGAATFLPHT